jgi:hypothetical protein
MGTAQEMLKNKQQKPNQLLPKVGTGEHPQRAGPWSLCPLPFLHLSFGHELRTGMVNKQVLGRKRKRKAWGREGQTPTHHEPGPGRALYRRKDAPERGDTVFRGLSGATLPTKNIYMHLPHWARCTEVPGRYLGDNGAIGPQMVTSRAQS